MIVVWSRIKGLLYGKLARASFWLVLGGLAAGALAYVFQVVMGRMLNTHDYGELSAMMSVFAVLGAPLGTLSMLVARKVSVLMAKTDHSGIANFYRVTCFRTGVMAIIPCLLWFFLAAPISSALKINELPKIYLLGTLIFFNFLPIINTAFLQGLQRFSWLSATGALQVVLKIIFTVLLVYFGYGVGGVLVGLILAIAAHFLLTIVPLLPTLLHTGVSTTQSERVPQPLSLKPALPVFSAHLGFALMTQMDLILVNSFFPAHEVGLYSAAAILGKAVMYLPGGFALALFPMVAENHERNDDSLHLLLQSLGLVFILSGFGACFYFIAGDWLIQVLYGAKYQGAGELLRYYGFAILPTTFVLLIKSFLIAKGRTLFAYSILPFSLIQITAIFFFHQSLFQVLSIIGATSLVLSLIGLMPVLLQFFRSRSVLRIKTI